MANPYSQYTGARVQPVPAGFIQAYGNVGKLYAQGLAGLGEGIGDAIEKYYEGKEERATLSGKGEGFVEAAEAYPGLYGSLMTDATKKKLQGMPDMGLNQLRQFIGKLDAQKTLLEKGETFKLKREELDSDKATTKATAQRAEKTFGLAEDKFEYQKTQDKADADQQDLANKLASDKFELSRKGHALTEEERNDRIAKEKEVEDRRVSDLQAALVSKGVLKRRKMVIAGRYLPDEGVSVSPDDPRGQFSPTSVPEFAPIGEEFYPAVKAGDVPLGLADAMGAASTSSLALKLWDDYQNEEWKKGASERDIKKTRKLREIPAAGDIQLSKLALAFKEATTDEEKRRLGGRAALLLMDRPGISLTTPLTPEDGQKYLSDSVFPELGASGSPTETAEERGRRNTYMSVLQRLDQLVAESEGNDWTGMLPSFKSKIADELLPKLGIDKHANWDRMVFRETAGITAWNLIRGLNEEGRLSDKDAERIEPLVPSKDDDFPIFRAKLESIKSIVVDKLRLQDAGAGREDVFSLAPVDFFTKLGKADEKLGGITPIPGQFGPSIIKAMPQFKYIGGDKSKPVTAEYVAKLAKNKEITPEAALLWIKHASIPLPKK
jgi:hypothetical protein